ncbi:MAG: PaaI family thioesterase [Acidobacteria bacterium]|nr:PaaI family thioesterase [Acidobacteriota bacterium]
MSKRHVFWEVVEGKLPMPPADQTLGFEVVEAIPDSGQITLEFTAKPEFCNVLGNIGGGFLAAMLDAVTSLAPATTYQHGEFGPTLELKVNFIRACKPGKLRGLGRTVQRTSSVAFVEGALRDANETVVATASATLRIIRSE